MGVSFVAQVVPELVEVKTGASKPLYTEASRVPSADEAREEPAAIGTGREVQVPPELVERWMAPILSVAILVPSAEQVTAPKESEGTLLLSQVAPALVEVKTPGRPTATNLNPSAEDATPTQ
jgi:hypothetical protein